MPDTVRLTRTISRSGSRGNGCLFSESDGTVICLAHTADAGPNKPEEGGEVFGVVEKVSEIEGQQGEVIGGIDAGVDVPQEPFIVVDDSFPQCRVRR